ncbi:MAG: GDP-mannose 4,6-dehydratase [Patescibacteria group bacterium]|jgi:CDP-glucose 4,6-dehydratase
MSLKGKNVLVTGATGLVGSHLTEKLLSLGALVTVTKRSSNPRSYFAGKNFGEKVIMADCDLKDFQRVFDVVTRYEIEYIFHVAAQPIVETAYFNPRETLEDNINGTINILESARLYPRVKGVVVASSDKAYGKKCDNATEDAPMAGDHPYDVSKSCADLITRTYAKTYGMPVAVSRFGNIYGPGDLNLNRIVPGIMKAAILGEELVIRSDGKFIRDYVYIKDVVDGYLKLMNNIEKYKGEAFNFSTGYNYSVLEMVEKIGAVMGKKVNFKIVNNQKNEIPEQSLNYDKAEKLLNWKSAFTFEEGIKETFEWYKNYLK